VTLAEKYDYFIFDLDGTIYRGEHLIPRADEVINFLRSSGKKIVFVSNKTTGTASDYYHLLKNWGLNIVEDQIINSTVVVANYLKSNFNGSVFFAVGEDSFIKEIEKSGLKYSTIPGDIKIIIITLDRTLNYQKLEIAAQALEKGAKFFAANIDDTCPVDSGEVLDAGSTISALEKRTHRKLEMHFGKPSEFMFNEIKNYLHFIPEKTLLIGDRIETDITMGNKFGIDTALVSTGVKYFSNGSENITPTYQISSVFDLLNHKT
jgi:phosphoglycolate/pyridoxal phosphate phosphatase family enzyme